MFSGTRISSSAIRRPASWTGRPSGSCWCGPAPLAGRSPPARTPARACHPRVAGRPVSGGSPMSEHAFPSGAPLLSRTYWLSGHARSTPNAGATSVQTRTTACRPRRARRQRSYGALSCFTNAGVVCLVRRRGHDAARDCDPTLGAGRGGRPSARARSTARRPHRAPASRAAAAAPPHANALRVGSARQPRRAPPRRPYRARCPETTRSAAHLQGAPSGIVELPVAFPRRIVSTVQVSCCSGQSPVSR